MRVRVTSRSNGKKIDSEFQWRIPDGVDEGDDGCWAGNWESSGEEEREDSESKYASIVIRPCCCSAALPSFEALRISASRQFLCEILVHFEWFFLPQVLEVFRSGKISL